MASRKPKSQPKSSGAREIEDARYEHPSGAWVAVKKITQPKETSAASPAQGGSTRSEGSGEDSSRSISVRMSTVVPGMSPWLPVTSKKTGYKIFVPLPIRLIQQIPDSEGGGCIVRGAEGDEATAKESIVQILDWLGGFPLGEGASSWAIAT
jgi:hypothetical protein